MNAIVSLRGSPSAHSRSAQLLSEIEGRLALALGEQFQLTRIVLRELPAAALLLARPHEPAIAEAVTALRDARVVLVASPIYKAAYSGLLKAFFDLLPQDALRGKTVVPLATGGSAGHLLALDYALKPVLGALGARDIRDAIYATDAQLPLQGAKYGVTADLQPRIESVVADLLGLWPARPAAAAVGFLHGVAPLPVTVLQTAALVQSRCSA